MLFTNRVNNPYEYAEKKVGKSKLQANVRKLWNLGMKGMSISTTFVDRHCVAQYIFCDTDYIYSSYNRIPPDRGLFAIYYT